MVPMDGKRIPIEPKLIWRIMRLLYQGRNPAEEFVGKDQDRAIVKSMKNNFGLVGNNTERGG